MSSPDVPNHLKQRASLSYHEWYLLSYKTTGLAADTAVGTQWDFSLFLQKGPAGHLAIWDGGGGGC